MLLKCCINPYAPSLCVGVSGAGVNNIRSGMGKRCVSRCTEFFQNMYVHVHSRLVSKIKLSVIFANEGKINWDGMKMNRLLVQYGKICWCFIV